MELLMAALYVFPTAGILAASLLVLAVGVLLGRDVYESMTGRGARASEPEASAEAA